MTDQSVNRPVHTGPRTPRTEFFVYFTLIFLVAIPFAALGWVGLLLRYGKLPEGGPLRRAWSDARKITPMIFLG
ncbi:MAG: cytochrome PufQ [Pseudorhodobacter sp.]|jgi:hypothetical protein|nr:cytochrome PufQ [Pseudorhodobacter sp.]